MMFLQNKIFVYYLRAKFYEHLKSELSYENNLESPQKINKASKNIAKDVYFIYK
jgi:hypothetical protein